MSIRNVSLCHATSPIMVIGPHALARSITWGIPVDIVEGNPGRDHSDSWHETHNITALEALTPGKAEDFANPDTVAQFPKERQKWLAAQAGGESYSFSNVARAQFASIEVQDKDEHLLADTMTANRAIKLLRDRANQVEPFFLAVGLIRPHFPFIATEKSHGPVPCRKPIRSNCSEWGSRRSTVASHGVRHEVRSFTHPENAASLNASAALGVCLGEGPLFGSNKLQTKPQNAVPAKHAEEESGASECTANLGEEQQA